MEAKFKGERVPVMESGGTLRKLAAVEARFGRADFERRHYALLAVMCTTRELRLLCRTRCTPIFRRTAAPIFSTWKPSSRRSGSGSTEMTDVHTSEKRSRNMASNGQY